MAVVTLKVPDILDRQLRYVAEKRGASKSAVIRLAVERFLRQDIDTEDLPSAYDLLKAEVGSVKGPVDLSCNPHHLAGYGK